MSKLEFAKCYKKLIQNNGSSKSDKLPLKPAFIPPKPETTDSTALMLERRFKNTYFELKEKSTHYNAAKWALIKTFEESDCGNWAIPIPHVDQFVI